MDRDSQIFAAYGEGALQKDIAREYGLSPSRISQIIIKKNISKLRCLSLKDQMDSDINTVSIKNTELSVRSKRTLDYENIETIGDLVRKYPDLQKFWRKIPNFGRKSFAEIENFILSLGIIASTS